MNSYCLINSLIFIKYYFIVSINKCTTLGYVYFRPITIIISIKNCSNISINIVIHNSRSWRLSYEKINIRLFIPSNINIDRIYTLRSPTNKRKTESSIDLLHKNFSDKIWRHTFSSEANWSNSRNLNSLNLVTNNNGNNANCISFSTEIVDTKCILSSNICACRLISFSWTSSRLNIFR